MISLLCPTRGRPKLAKKMIDSALATAATDIEILLYLNDNDPCLDEYRDTIDSKYIEVGQDRSPGYSWNLLSDKSKRDIHFLVGDDLWFITKNWDEMSVGYFDRVPDKLACIFPKHDMSEKNPHFMLHQNWKRVLGYFVPHQFHQWYVDTWTRNLARKVNRYIRMEDVHVSAINSKNLQDDTTKRSEKSWTRVNDGYMWQRSQRWLNYDAELLKKVING